MTFSGEARALDPYHLANMAYVPKIGFVILSHNRPDQALSLVKTLNSLFDEPPIACHHDSGQSSIDESLFPRNVHFVHPHVATGWGEISVPLAAMRAFELLRAHDSPEWFVLLSSSDYPVRPAAEIRGDLASSEYDVHLDHREIQYGVTTSGTAGHESSFQRPDYIPLAYDRYFAARVRLPCLSKKKLLAGTFPIRLTQTLVTRNPTLSRALQRICFHGPVRIFGGDFWFHANKKAVNRLLDDPGVRRFAKYYRARPNADESFFHTFLCNQPDLRISTDHKRYADWPLNAVHPRLLDISDVPKIVASGAYFARKFRSDGITQAYIARDVLNLTTGPC